MHQEKIVLEKFLRRGVEGLIIKGGGTHEKQENFS